MKLKRDATNKLTNLLTNLLIATTLPQLQNMLKDVKQAAERIGLQLHLDKTKIISNTPGDTWANQDRPVDVRTATSALFGIKRMLVQWGYNKHAIHVDTTKGTMNVAGKEVLKVVVQDFVLTLTWSDGQWEQWSALQSAPELSSLKEASQGRLDRAKANASIDFKGKGKGLPGFS